MKHNLPDINDVGWIGFMIVPYDMKLVEQPSWCYKMVGDPTSGATMKCSNGHIGSLIDHEIDDLGDVAPSVECGDLDCDFHSYVRLKGWGE